MSYKKGTNVMLLLITLVSAIFLYQSFSLKTLTTNQPIGPDFFPKVISILLIITCIISFITTLKKTEDRKVELEKFKFVIYTVVAAIVFVMCWQFLGLFYVCSFIFLFALLYLYNNNGSKFKKILTSLGISLVVILFVYAVFGKLLNVLF
ncbi:tripartite tricarboxylate transporter TctB family protein [Robertmurraya yapensis]|uniref:Tripartite tricarboxylate transporter TctB family protein n=1 Tax=Bacillus yapensis TaxID=2492960 RepID=A0A431WIE5_9BACI|nr:tripartite tricarboxylate transporter TctB family protein [Bacillus yapensis]RTR35174.1 tripartite tricarboxylate transporter TctB family protein [Bacillus yapensis]TKS97683.1 tripartite tricarboxylate transporter TctB family protein [Bacillus yapensis]